MKKRLVVLFDGTWRTTDRRSTEFSKDGENVTNVVRFLEALNSGDNHKNVQLVHYVPGIGTRKFERFLGGVFGYGIGNYIKDAYSFIVSNYMPGDEIYLLGFSRGAYSARSLAGMIHNVGILQRRFLYLLNDAYDHYRSREKAWHPDAENSKNFRQQYTWGDEHKNIRFLGVWDTVAALGSPYGLIFSKLVDQLFNRQFHDTKLSTSVLSAYQALAIDEARWPFRPVHLTLDWMIRKAKEHGLNIDAQLISEPYFSPDFLESVPKRDWSKWVYRAATLLGVKLLSIYYVSDENRPLVKYIAWNGDYIRPIDDMKRLSPEVSIRMKMDENYRPANCSE